MYVDGREYFECRFFLIVFNKNTYIMKQINIKLQNEVVVQVKCSTFGVKNKRAFKIFIKVILKVCISK